MRSESGLSQEERARIRQLSADIVNLAYFERYEASAEAARELVMLAEELQQKYGPRLELLVVRAEHVLSTPERESLLREIYWQAKARGDVPYEGWAAHSLASHYVDAAWNLPEAERWLAITQELLGESDDEYVTDDLDRLGGILRARRMRGLTPGRKGGRRRKRSRR